MMSFLMPLVGAIASSAISSLTNNLGRTGTAGSGCGTQPSGLGSDLISLGGSAANADPLAQLAQTLLGALTGTNDASSPLSGLTAGDAGAADDAAQMPQIA